MKILHTADVHLGELTGPIINGENARMQDTVNCMQYLVDKAKEEKPDAIVIAGDLYNKSKLWADEMLNEISITSSWLRKLGDIAPTVLMFGTDNHDNKKAFENIKKMEIENLAVVINPDFSNISTKNGSLQIAAIPGLSRGYFRENFPGLDKEDENKAISKILGDVVMGISANAKPNIPTILISHYTVAGCSLENGEQIFLNSDIVIPTEALAASNYDLVCLGHIHKAQSVLNCGRPVYYSGPPNGITFNEEGQAKGFYIHEIINNQVNSSFIETPYRAFRTLEFDEGTVRAFIDEKLSISELYKDEIENKITRVIYSCTDEDNKKFNKKLLEKKLYEAGAFYVSEIKPKKIITTTNKKAMSENDSVIKNLEIWLKDNEFTIEQSEEVLKIAEPLIAQVSASLTTGKLNGIFEPVILEVKNYRSYKEEKFDFEKVNFATVNGPNGIGKSSFFMDAMHDCLYEEPREGELTGWISNDETVRSGAIAFTFKIGNERWRVIRTRAKSGKATLTLQKYYNKEWKDQSESRKDQTQAKIERVIGMDPLTFKSCALIMQDNYGAFLEADKTERMQVLSNILGLQIYEKLAELVKDKARGINKDIEKLKNEIMLLDKGLEEYTSTDEKISRFEEDKKLELNRLEKQEIKLKELHTQANRYTELNNKLQDLSKNVISNESELSKKNYEKSNLEDVINNAKKILLKENLINEKSDAAQKLRERISVIKTKEEIYNKKLEEDSNVNKEIEAMKNEKEKAEKIVGKEDVILKKIDEYELTKEKITVIKAKQPVYTEKKKEIYFLEVEIEEALNKEKKLTEEINLIQNEMSNIDQLKLDVEKIEIIRDKCDHSEKLKTKKEDIDKQCNEVIHKIHLAEREHKTKNEILTTELLNCKKKSELIDNSKCPVDNPTCNFLKDALLAKNKIANIELEIKNLDHSHIYKLHEEYTNLQKELRELEYDKEMHEELKNKFEKLKQSKAQLEKIESKKPLLETLKAQRISINKQKGILDNKKYILTKDVIELKKEIDPLQKLEENMLILEQWYKGKDELPKAKQSLETCKKRLIELEEVAQILKLELNNLSDEIRNLDKLKDDLAALKEFENQKEEIPVAKQVIKSNESGIKILSNEINEKQKMLKVLNQKKEEVSVEISELHDIDDLIRNEEHGIKITRNKLSYLDTEIGKLQSKIDEMDKCYVAKKDKNKLLAVKAKSHSLYEILIKSFSIDGIPFQIIRSVVSELSDQSNEILSQMTGGKMSLELKTDKIQKNKKEINALEVWISDYQRGTMPYLSRSGGQKVKAALSFAFALADLKAKRNGIQLGMMFIDEPPFLDAEGAQAYCDALEVTYNRYPNMKILAISHDEAMKARFPQSINVVDTENGSKILF